MHGPTIGELGSSAATTVANTHVPSGSDCEFVLFVIFALLIYYVIVSIWLALVDIDLSKSDFTTKIIHYTILPIIGIQLPIMGIVLGIQNAQESRHWSGSIGYGCCVVGCVALLVGPLVYGHFSRAKRTKDAPAKES